jgi:hypothetical protein
MVVRNLGYIKFESLPNLGHFSIYETSRKTVVLIKDTSLECMDIYRPRRDRLPYQVEPGKRICSCYKIHDSKTDSLQDIDPSKLNMGKQIIAYEELYEMSEGGQRG